MSPHFYDDDLPPDDTRVIQPPVRTPEDFAYLSRVRKGTLALIAAGMSVLAALLELFGAPPLLP